MNGRSFWGIQECGALYSGLGRNVLTTMLQFPCGNCEFLLDLVAQPVLYNYMITCACVALTTDTQVHRLGGPGQASTSREKFRLMLLLALDLDVGVNDGRGQGVG